MVALRLQVVVQLEEAACPAHAEICRLDANMSYTWHTVQCTDTLTALGSGATLLPETACKGSDYLVLWVTGHCYGVGSWCGVRLSKWIHHSHIREHLHNIAYTCRAMCEDRHITASNRAWSPGQA